MALQGCAIYSDIWYRPYLWPNCLESYLNKLQVYSMSTSIYTRTTFKILLMSQFPREPLTYKKSKRKLIIFFTRAPPLESPFLCWLLFQIRIGESDCIRNSNNDSIWTIFSNSIWSRLLIWFNYLCTYFTYHFWFGSTFWFNYTHLQYSVHNRATS